MVATVEKDTPAQGKLKITSWDKLRKHMRSSFLPYNYECDLYPCFQCLRQGQNYVDEYTREFMNFWLVPN